jgi:hypothetical protein
MNTDIHLIRIDMTNTPDLDRGIKDTCVAQAGRDNPRRLVSTFSSNNQVILIFELCNQD